MFKKQKNGGDSGKKNAIEKRKKQVWHGKLGGLVFVSLYDLVTWVFIALCVGLVLIYGFQHNRRGFFWSLGALLFFVLIMLAIRAKQHFDAEQSRSELSIENKTERAKFTLTPGTSLDPKKRFETRFILTNDNPFTVYNLNYVCLASGGGGGVAPAVLIPDVKEFGAGQSRSLYCNYCNFPSEFLSVIKGTAGTIFLRITIACDGLPPVDFDFFAKRNADGIFVWFPKGEGDKGVFRAAPAPVTVPEKERFLWGYHPELRCLKANKPMLIDLVFSNSNKMPIHMHGTGIGLSLWKAEVAKSDDDVLQLSEWIRTPPFVLFPEKLNVHLVTVETQP